MLALPDKVYCCSVPFLSAKDQLAIAIKSGRKDRDIFVEGRSAESFAACLAAIRGPGMLGLVGGARILGKSRHAVMAGLRLLRERGIRPYDLQTGMDDPAELLHEAARKIQGSKALRNNPRQPKRIGRRGGLVKGYSARERRHAEISEEIITRLVAHPKLTYQDCANILGGPPFSASTLRRHYGT